MTKKFELLPPMMPNFIYIKTEPKPRQEGFTPHTIPVKDMDEQEAQEYGELMKQAFIQHWKDKKNNQTLQP